MYSILFDGIDVILFVFQEMLAFQNDRSFDVKKFVVGFIEEAW